jgi:hypothetical protein
MQESIMSRPLKIFLALIILCDLLMAGFLIFDTDGASMKPLMPKIVVTYPLRTFRFSIADDGQNQLVARFKKFAAANQFTFRSAQVRPDPRYIAIGMKRNDFDISADDPFTPNDFYISFDKNAPDAPPVPENTLDVVAASLKTFVPGIRDDARNPTPR